MAVEMMLERLRIDRTGTNLDWPSIIAERSNGWPQHLHNSMGSPGFDLLRSEGHLAHVDAGAVEAKEREYRILTFGRRMSPEIRRAGLLTVRDCGFRRACPPLALLAIWSERAFCRTAATAFTPVRSRHCAGS